MVHSEELSGVINQKDLNKIRILLNSDEDDAQIIFWGFEEDIPTALETIEERCIMAFSGVPNETRKSLTDGTTIFERVLPGADRMYPDTDSPPIPLEDEYIERLRKNLTKDISERYTQLKNWQIPKDTYNYILRNNLVPLIERINKFFNIKPRFIGTFLGHCLKHYEGQFPVHPDFTYEKIYELFEFLNQENLEQEISKIMIPVIYEHPNMDMESVLFTINFKKRSEENILAPVENLILKVKETKKANDKEFIINWLMGHLHKQAIGNISLKYLRDKIEKKYL